MKPRHAAALALVGWYLIQPPLVFRALWTVNTDAPLTKWEMSHSFDSAAECEAERARRSTAAVEQIVAFTNLSDVEQLTELKKKRSCSSGPCPALGAVSFLVAAQSTYAVCIASDDPRLKGN